MKDESLLEAAEPNPRAFAIGTGVVFQTVGVCLALAACILWALSQKWIAPTDAPAANWWEFFSTRFVPAVWTIGILTSFVYGLALAATGIGLQGERPGSARLAVGVNAAAAAAFAAMAILLVVREGRFTLLVLPVFMALIGVGLLVLSTGCVSTFRQFPPPPDLNRATPEMLEEHRRKREERYRSLD